MLAALNRFTAILPAHSYKKFSSLVLLSRHRVQLERHTPPSSSFARNVHWSTLSMSGMADEPKGTAIEGDQPVKTAKQLKKEAQKKEKMEKFLAKQSKKEEASTSKVCA